MPCMGQRVDVQEADPPIGGATGAQAHYALGGFAIASAIQVSSGCLLGLPVPLTFH
jgi:hypothetical protein